MQQTASTYRFAGACAGEIIRWSSRVKRLMGSIQFANVCFASAVTTEFPDPDEPIATIRQYCSTIPKKKFCGPKREPAGWRPGRSNRIPRRGRRSPILLVRSPSNEWHGRIAREAGLAGGRLSHTEPGQSGTMRPPNQSALAALLPHVQGLMLLPSPRPPQRKTLSIWGVRASSFRY